ncbi:MAG TPA: hypothetical protein VMT70_07650 [Vicinamibacteria bacterium]|nr:hypothetical protein [Vicinamibacteria bacterium]
MRLEPGFRTGALVACLAGSAVLAGGTRAAWAAGDEIQVYLDDMSLPGEIALDVHLNDVLSGRTTPAWSGELPPDHVFQATPEFGFGVKRRLELGLYLPVAFGPDGAFYANGVKVRAKVVPQQALQGGFFWGVNVELGCVARRVSEERWTVELRPIAGWRNGRWLVAANPILDFTAGAPSSSQGDFEPAVKVGFQASRALMVGVEYYGALGPPSQTSPRGARRSTTPTPSSTTRATAWT